MTKLLGGVKAGSGSAFGLEVWMTGTPAELNALAAALRALGRTYLHDGREPLSGADRGRYKTYALVHIGRQ